MKQKKYILLALAYFVFVFVLYYVQLPALNWHDPAFYQFILIVLAVPILPLIVLSHVPTMYTDIKVNKRYAKYAAIGFSVCVVLPLLLSIVSMKVFHAEEYANRVLVEEVDFAEIEEVDFTKTPIIDRTTTEALGDRVMGQMSDLVSQFTVSDEYTQISYQESVYRVTPLEYADLYRWFTNRAQGIPAYIRVDSTSGEAELVRLEDLGYDNMRYVPSAMLNENLYRHLRFSYPTEIFGDPSFEIDEEGYPWYVCTTYTYKGVGQKKSVNGAIIVDPISGESQKYELDEIPQWADRIYPESLVIEEIDDYGSLQDGFINSLIGQKGVVVSSDGYNYIEKDDDIWMYTGITSVTKDESNLGFVLVNMRTHEALRIDAPGANENSAMKSAEDEVKNYGYEATFPILVNVNERPTYMMALRAPSSEDSMGVIKQYAMVDVEDYQKVVISDVNDGFESLKKMMIEVQGDTPVDVEEEVVKTITIASIEKVYIDGNTKYYLSDSEGNKYKVNFTTQNEDVLAFLALQDEVEVSYTQEEEVIELTSIKIKGT